MKFYRLQGVFKCNLTLNPYIVNNKTKWQVTTYSRIELDLNRKKIHILMKLYTDVPIQVQDHQQKIPILVLEAVVWALVFLAYVYVCLRWFEIVYRLNRTTSNHLKLSQTIPSSYILDTPTAITLQIHPL